MTDPADRYERCSGQAALRGDPMTGSAFPASRLLLVEQPGPWGRAGLLASRFDTGMPSFAARRGAGPQLTNRLATR